MAGIHNVLAGAAGKRDMSVVIGGDQWNVNLRSLLISAGWNSEQVLDAVVTIPPSVVVSSSTTGGYALDTGVTPFPPGSKVRVNNQGFIVGRGGDANSGNGGPALRVVGGLNLEFSMDNTGTIAGGGGGGGAGQSLRVNYQIDVKTSTFIDVSGGLGGGGRTGRTNSYPNGTFVAAGSGADGTSANGGSYPFSATGGRGGDGGHWGTNGNPGGIASHSGGTPGTSSGPTAGGSAGVAVAGNGNINWINTGTRLGAIT